jgi:hypothetical protein
MLRFARTHLLKLGLTALVMLIPASPALAEESTAPVLNMTVLGAVHKGEPVQFSGSSVYTSEEQLYLTVFAAPSNHCPSSDAPPAGSDIVLHKEAVDNFLSVTDLSDNLSTAGQWALCSYLTNLSSSTIAASSVPFLVIGSNGPAGHSAGHKLQHGKKHKSKKHKKH